MLGPLIEEIFRSATLAQHGSNSLEISQLIDLIWPFINGHPTLGGYTGEGVWADGVIGPGVGVWICLLFGLRSKFVQRCLLAWALCVAIALFVEVGPLNNARLAGIGAIWLALATGASIRRERFSLLAIPLLMLSWHHARALDHHTIPAAQHAPPPSQWATELDSLAGDSRVTGLGWVLAPNTGALAGLRDIRGYDLPVSKDWERFARRLDPRLLRPNFPIERVTVQNSRLLSFSGVRYVVSEDILDLPYLTEVAVGESPVSVYELGSLALDEPAPRAWLTAAAGSVASPEEAIDGLAVGRYNHGYPPVERLGQPLDGARGFVSLEVIEHRPEQIELVVSPEGRSIAVLADAWHPGWVAEVDGEPRDILRVGGYFKGVVVEPTDSSVVFVYEPSGWLWGRLLSFVGLISLLLLSRLRFSEAILSLRGERSSQTS